MMLKLEHIIVTRFSFRGKDALKHLDGPTWKVSEDPLQFERMELRFKIFESTCLPSVMAQAGREFSWIIIVDKDLQAPFRSRLESLLQGRGNFFIHTYDAEDKLDRLGWLEPYMQTRPDYVITTNLDDDDVLPNNFTSMIRKHISSTFQAGDLPPVKTLGVKEIIQWDMITSRHAPLGWRSPWHRGKRTSSCGFSLLVRYPCFPFCVLGMKHSHAENYFDFTRPPKDRHEELCRSAFVAAGNESDQRIDNFSANSMFHDLSSETGPVLMSNHTDNDQRRRLYERKSGKVPVTGPETFPNLTVDFKSIEKYSEDFRDESKPDLKSVLGAYFKRVIRRGKAD